MALRPHSAPPDALAAHVVMAPQWSLWPVPRQRNWVSILNTPPSDAEREAVRRHIERSSPMGSDVWVKATAHALGLQQTLNPRGRPLGWRKHQPGDLARKAPSGRR